MAAAKGNSGSAGGNSGSAGKRGRSAISGRFVPQAAVNRSPKTTVNESTKKSK